MTTKGGVQSPGIRAKPHALAPTWLTCSKRLFGLGGYCPRARMYSLRAVNIHLVPPGLVGSELSELWLGLSTVPNTLYASLCNAANTLSEKTPTKKP